MEAKISKKSLSYKLYALPSLLDEGLAVPPFASRCGYWWGVVFGPIFFLLLLAHKLFMAVALFLAVPLLGYLVQWPITGRGFGSGASFWEILAVGFISILVIVGTIYGLVQIVQGLSHASRVQKIFSYLQRCKEKRCPTVHFVD